VFREAGLRPGETLLVHGGASGVGTAAIQLAKALGPSPVIVTVGSEDKAAACRALGADHAILYKTEDFAKRVLEITGKRGADVILDHIGGSYLEPNLACLALYGRLVIIGLLGGAKAELNIGRLMVKRQRIIGSVLRARPVEEKARVTAAFREQVLGRFASGELKPVIHEVLPLEQARRAHELMAANANTGKLVLLVDRR
jgi:NADPH:quinone reductase